MATKEIMGVSIAQLVTVAGIVAALGAGVQLFKGSGVSNEAAYVNQLVSDARAYASADADASNVSVANLYAAKKVPPNRYLSATTMSTPWGGTLTLATTTISAGTDGISLTYSAVPPGECTDFGKTLGPGAAIVKIGGTTTKAYGAALATTGASGVNTLCTAASTESMEFDFSIKGQ